MKLEPELPSVLPNIPPLDPDITSDERRYLRTLIRRATHLYNVLSREDRPQNLMLMRQEYFALAWAITRLTHPKLRAYAKQILGDE